MKKLGILALMAVLLTGIAYAACTFTTPGASATLRGGSQLINVSCAAADDVVNCSVSASSALTGDSIAAFDLFNTTTDTGANATISTLEGIDATDWIFSGTCQNASADSYTITSRSGVTIDNTKPTCTHSQSSRTEYLPTQTWTITGTNATSTTIQFGAQSTATMTESSAGDSFTYAYGTSSTGTLPEGTYDTVTAITSDGTNTTTCTLDYVVIDSKATMRQTLGATSAAAGKKVSTGGMSKSTVLLIVIGIAAFWYVKKKK